MWVSPKAYGKTIKHLCHNASKQNILWKSRSFTKWHKRFAFSNPNLVQHLWVSLETVKRLKSDFKKSFHALAWENPKFQLGATKHHFYKLMIKSLSEKALLWKSYQKGCAGPATKHLKNKSCGAKTQSSKIFNATLNADDQNGCWKGQCFFQSTSKNAIPQEISIHVIASCSVFKEPKSILKKKPNDDITLLEAKQLAKNDVPLQTHWQIVASVPQIVLNYWTALRKPKNDSQAIKRNHHFTKNKKSVWECRVFDKSSQKALLQLRPQLNEFVKDAQELATPKPFWETIDP